MNGSIALRPATLRDADLLLEWRNDPATRAASHDTSRVAQEEHIAWLSAALNNPDRKLYIAEENGAPVGTVRADCANGVWNLSWTVAPQARGRGVAKRMVALLASRISDPIRAEVKAGNVASARIAQHAGMTLERESNAVLHYARPALK